MCDYGFKVKDEDIWSLKWSKQEGFFLELLGCWRDEVGLLRRQKKRVMSKAESQR